MAGSTKFIRWLRGLPATNVTAEPRGGYCAGSGRRIPAEDALLTLAGMATEADYMILPENVLWAGTSFQDLEEARELL